MEIKRNRRRNRFFYDLNPGTRSTTSISQMYSVNGSQFFWTYTASSLQSQLWQTDGTAFGTTNFSEIGGEVIGGLAAGNYLYYIGQYGNLWRTDATAYEQPPTEIYVVFGLGSGLQLANLNGTIVCNGSDTSDAAGEWDDELRGILPGSAHAILIKNINTQEPVGSGPYNFIRVGNEAYFTADDIAPHSVYNQLWVTDGTEAGTHEIRQLNTMGFHGAAPLGNSLLFFDYADAYNGPLQLWKTDGTAGGTVMVQNNVAAGAQIVTAGKLAYFGASYSGTGYELWASDGTTDGTHLVDDINPGKGDSSPNQFASVGDEIYFEANDGIHGTQLWKSDGTAQGTIMVSAISGVGNLMDLTNVGGILYFVTAPPSGTSNYQENLSLWKSDGTTAGTVQIIDAAGQLAGSFANLTTVGDGLYFTANTAANGVELWKTDGTPAGTEMVDDILPGPDRSSPTSLTAMGNTLYFSAIDSSGEGQLFRTDGTVTSTIQLTHGLTFNAPNLSDKRGVRGLTAVGDTLFFAANDGVHGNELWRSDGTAAGTSMVEDIGPGDSVSGSPQPLSMGNYLLFSADDEQVDDELWRAEAALPPPGTGSISGTVFCDSNGNGQWDGSEVASPSWQVFLDTNDDGVNEPSEPLVTCNSQGQYTFTNVLPGTYRVRLISQDLWTQTAPFGGTQFVTVSVGQATTNVNFGEVPGDAKAAPIASLNTIFIGDNYTLDLSYEGLHSATSWTVNWGDGSPVQTFSGNPVTISHTYGLSSGSSPFTILAWANSVDGSAPVLPMTVAVYAPPILNNGLLSLAGTLGNDTVSFDEIPNELFTVTFNGVVRQYNLSLLTKISYADGSGDDSIEVHTFTIPATLNLTSGNDTIANYGFSPVYVAAGTGKMTVNARGGTTIIPANSGSGIRELCFAAINISNGAKFVLANSSATLGDYSHHANRSVAVVDPSGLTIASGGTLDLGDNDLILDYPGTQATARSLISALVITGYGTSKNFSGTGITSSGANYDAVQSAGVRALGWGDNADLGKTSFDGVTLSSPNEMLVKFTYYGDCNLDGIVDTGGDLALFAKGFHGQGSGWDFGDFNYDGATNNPDLSLYARGLNNGYRMFGAL